ncbi:MAG: TrkH family potassium uptake protein [Archaeoglobaceae archaeon]|nr:TrkH family potassium uptake protein [Archaeoglobaceae archaeon]MDW7989880.1 TrkH family potassium uptake protein [Archaeoglobaceae archaeon]
MLSLTFSVPIAVAYVYSERVEIFLVPLFLTLLLAIIFLILSRKRSVETVGERETYITVALIWLLIPLFGSIPFILNNVSPIDAFFESFSGFTTTGATVLVPENLPKSLQFWRGMMQWLGGFGIVILTLIFLPQIKKSSALFMAEYPSVVMPKIKPRIRDMAIVIFQIYFILTILEITILTLLGVDLFKAVVHSFTTISTGGFSTNSESISAFQDVRVEAAIAFFAFVGGMNFGIIYALTNKQLRSLADLEFRYYSTFILISIAALTFINLNHYGFLDSIRFSAFQAISIMTTTGFTTADFNSWSDSAKMIILTLMLIGGCSGSTAGGMKVIRFVILIKYISLQIYRIMEPRAVRTVRYGNYVLEKDYVEEILAFFVLFIFIFFISSLFLSLIGYDLETSLSLSASSLGNVGPAFGMAAKNVAEFSEFAKVILIINMWVGRLEIIPVFTLLLSLAQREKW